MRSVVRAARRRADAWTMAAGPLMAAVAVAAGAVSSTAAAQQLDPASLATRVGIDQQLGARLPMELPLRDEAGRAVTLGEVIDTRPVILVLVYYECPMLCGVALRSLVKNMKVLGLDLGREYDVVTVSIDPDETPAEALLAEARSLDQLGAADDRQARAGWHALTAEQASIETLARTVGFRYVYDPVADEYAHGAAIMVVTPEGTVSRYFYGVEYPARDLRFGLVEAAQERIGSIADRVMLLCYRYDPAAGTYGFAVWTAIRIAGVATVLALGSFIALSLRRERAEAPRPADDDGSVLS